MEDRKLNEKESLELITQMIQNTRRTHDAIWMLVEETCFCCGDM